jgi:hypothetical protein
VRAQGQGRRGRPRRRRTPRPLQSAEIEVGSVITRKRRAGFDALQAGAGIEDCAGLATGWLVERVERVDTGDEARMHSMTDAALRGFTAKHRPFGRMQAVNFVSRRSQCVDCGLKACNNVVSPCVGAFEQSSTTGSNSQNAFREVATLD